eukprot:Skav223993  [mRNA]  locus=scaffold1943:115422:116382:- [translate_table: standard]
MFHLMSRFSGELMATLNAEEVNGRSTRSLKTCVFSITGISRFRQRLFLEDGSEIAAQEELSLTPQHLQIVLLQFLAPDAVQEGRFVEACINSNIQSLEACLEEPQDPNRPFEFPDEYKGCCPIHVVGGCCPIPVVARQGSLPCLDLLLEAGADKDSTTMAPHDGATPLFEAAASGRMEVVRFLVEAEADMNKANDIGATPLLVAAGKGQNEVVYFLVKAGADMNKVANDGTALRLCSSLSMAALKGHMDVVGFLFEAGADVNKAMNDGAAPLFAATQNGHSEIVCLLRHI